MKGLERRNRDREVGNWERRGAEKESRKVTEEQGNMKMEEASCKARRKREERSVQQSKETGRGRNETERVRK